MRGQAARRGRRPPSGGADEREVGAVPFQREHLAGLGQEGQGAVGPACVGEEGMDGDAVASPGPPSSKPGLARVLPSMGRLLLAGVKTVQGWAGSGADARGSTPSACPCSRAGGPSQVPVGADGGAPAPGARNNTQTQRLNADRRPEPIGLHLPQAAPAVWHKPGAEGSRPGRGNLDARAVLCYLCAGPRYAR